MQENNTKGHRERLLNRFNKSGLNGLHEYEIVELLCMLLIPRRDVKPLAKKLCADFGSINELINAEQSKLISYAGLTERNTVYLSFLKELMAYCLKERFSEETFITSRADVESYLKFHLGHRKDEYLAVLFLDTANRILSFDIMAEGTVNQCVVYPRAICEKALEKKASALILIHNHPAQTPQASKPDWLITEKVRKACSVLEIQLVDHLIVTREKTISLRDDPLWPSRR